MTVSQGLEIDDSNKDTDYDHTQHDTVMNSKSPAILLPWPLLHWRWLPALELQSVSPTVRKPIQMVKAMELPVQGSTRWLGANGRRWSSLRPVTTEPRLCPRELCLEGRWVQGVGVREPSTIVNQSPMTGDNLYSTTIFGRVLEAVEWQNYIVSHVFPLKKIWQLYHGRPRGKNDRFELFVEHNQRVQVCKFFLSTLLISNQMVRYNLKLAKHGTWVQSQLGSPSNIVNDAARQLVQNHVNSFPGVESHYCWSSTKRE